jgi:hypothetical protein
MALQRKLWSLNALSTELRANIRTMARALSEVPSDGAVSKHRAWYLSTAIEALRRHREGKGIGVGQVVGTAQVEHICTELELLAGEIQTGLRRLAAEKSIKRRREIAKDVGPLIGRFDVALARSAVGMSEPQRFVTQPFRDQLVGRAIAELLALCEWKLDAAT